MAWHHKHFPTFHSAARFYKERDIFEKAAINFIAWGGVVYIAFYIFFAAPIGFPTGAYIKIEEGMSLREIAALFEDHHVINGAWRFEVITRFLGDEKHIPAGQYFFSRQENMIWVSMRILNGDFETSPVRVTIPEGMTANQISLLLLEKVPEFNRHTFLERAQEGYLFPDTYFFRPGQSTEAILSVFENNFRVRMLRVQKDLTASQHSIDEVLTMASLLEKEASKTEDRKMIAGVLWHRIEIGMPLQVDATFPYYLGRNTFEVTLQDLKTDHPYNTYTNKGLPPGPIDNPGLDAIMAALTPTKTKYVYFLSDKNGIFHYSVTYEGHLANKKRYLD